MKHKKYKSSKIKKTIRRYQNAGTIDPLSIDTSIKTTPTISSTPAHDSLGQTGQSNSEWTKGTNYSSFGYGMSGLRNLTMSDAYSKNKDFQAYRSTTESIPFVGGYAAGAHAVGDWVAQPNEYGTPSSEVGAFVQQALFDPPAGYLQTKRIYDNAELLEKYGVVKNPKRHAIKMAVAHTLLPGIAGPMNKRVLEKLDRVIDIDQYKKDRIESGNLYSKHGGRYNLGGATGSYNGMKQGVLKQLDKDLFLTTPTSNTHQSKKLNPKGGMDMETDGGLINVEGNEIINAKDNYMLSSKTNKDLNLAKKLKHGGDFIDQKTKDYNLKYATAYNDKELIKKGMFDRVSFKNGGCPPGMKCGGKMKYDVGGLRFLKRYNFGNEVEPLYFNEYSKGLSPTYFGLKDLAIQGFYPDSPRYHAPRTKVIKPSYTPGQYMGSSGPNYNIRINAPDEIVNEPLPTPKTSPGVSLNKFKPAPGDYVAMAAAGLDSLSQFLLAKKLKKHLVNYSDIPAKLQSEFSKAESQVDFGESEAIKDIIGTTNAASNISVYPSYQIRNAVLNDILKGQASNIAKTRGQFAQLRAELKSDLASRLAQVQFQTRTTQDQINAQEEDKKLQAYADASKNFANNMFTTLKIYLTEQNIIRIS
ncbi:MAG: hypothetical protein KatS3mg002_1397 [Candidatus Woesearchaeota archaeon]|nr:MAG: hypothetical protein KatS3mg002_1397 [Candidatus Woesearchaeota archaeon]